MIVHGPVPTKAFDRRGGDRHLDNPITVRFPLGMRAAIDRARGCDRSGRCRCGAPTRNAFIVGLVESGLIRSAEVADLPRTDEVNDHSLAAR